jgi:hypothetical protein
MMAASTSFFDFLERQARDLASDRIETRHDNRIRSVVDDDVHSRGQFERADVPSLTADDAALHLVVRQRHRGHGRFRRRVGSDTLDRECDDLLRFTLGVAASALADLAQRVGGVSVRLFLESPDQFVLRILRRHSRHLFQAATLVRDELLELLLARLHQLLAASEVTRALADFAIARLHQLELAIEHALALTHAPLFLLHRDAPSAKLQLGGLAQLHHLFLSRDDSALTRRLDLTLRVRDDALRGFLGSGLRGGQSFDLRFPARVDARLAAQKEKCR